LKDNLRCHHPTKINFVGTPFSFNARPAKPGLQANKIELLPFPQGNSTNRGNYNKALRIKIILGINLLCL